MTTTLSYFVKKSNNNDNVPNDSQGDLKSF